MIRIGLFILAMASTTCFWFALVPEAMRTRIRRLKTPTDVKVIGCVWVALLVVSVLTPGWLGWDWLALGLMIFIFGRILFIFTVRENPFYSPQITAPPVIIQTGPYRFLNHPGYWGHGLSALGIWTIWLSVWALPLLLLFWGTLIWRGWRESKLLHLFSQRIP